MICSVYGPICAVSLLYDVEKFVFVVIIGCFSAVRRVRDSFKIKVSNCGRSLFLLCLGIAGNCGYNCGRKLKKP